MKSTMQDFELGVGHILRHGSLIHRHSRVLTFDGAGVVEATYAEVAARVDQLASALVRLGVERGDRVATMMWNTQEHLEAYLAVPSMGAVLHPLNPRLPVGQLASIVDTAGDKVLVVHMSLLPLARLVLAGSGAVHHVVVVSDAPGKPAEIEEGLFSGSVESVVGYEQILADEPSGFTWPEVNERDAAGVSFTSGTTGEPKGVVYSHRSTFLHTLSAGSGSGFAVDDNESLLVLVPMFHVNGWGLPYIGWLNGATIVMPHRWLQGEPLCKLIDMVRPTVAAGVPTIWAGVLDWADSHPEIDLSSMRLAMSGGAALNTSLIEGFKDRHGVTMRQGWGMTETSPVCTIGSAPAGFEGDPLTWQMKAGRIIPGVEIRIMTIDRTEAPWDGETVGEIEVRGPWVTASYLGEDSSDRFDDGWLRTGDIGSIDDRGYVRIADRIKDVIKSGGEWIPSVELENVIMASDDVAEACVIGISDEKWGERPLAVVVLASGHAASPADLRQFLESKVVHWWVPERWCYVSEIPKTSVGKFDKKALRERFAAGELEVVESGDVAQH